MMARHRNVAIGIAIATIAAGGAVAPGIAAAAAPGAGWEAQTVAQPTHLSSANNESCTHREGCDTVNVIVTNVGARAGAPVTIADTLPKLAHARSVIGHDQTTGNGLGCSVAPLLCKGSLGAGETAVVTIEVTVAEGASAQEGNVVSVSGGGAPAVTSSEEIEFSPEAAPFEIQDFALGVFDGDGRPSTQAGGHPYVVATNLYFSSDGLKSPVEEVKDVVVDLPAGLVGNPLATPRRCPLYALLENSEKTACPVSSRVGTIVFESYPGVFRGSERAGLETTAIYNMQPEAGFPAELGFTYLGKAVYMLAGTVRIDGQLRVRVSVPGIPTNVEVLGVTLAFFGNPSEHFGEAGPGERYGEADMPAPFFTNPDDCEAHDLTATVEADTWLHPGYYHIKEAVSYPQLTGCGALQFQPSLQMRPETAQADAPSGYAFTVNNPQSESALTPGTAELKDATVTLPAGVSLSPAAADGLQACAATGPAGINIGSGATGITGQDIGDPEATEIGEGHPGGSDPASPYDDGLYHTAPGHCPAASAIGTVEVQTPLLSGPLTGHVYVAQPECGGAGQPQCTSEDALGLPGRPHLYGIYLEAAGFGAIVKLAGEAALDPLTGQITARFQENPQVPFSALTLRLNGGPRAPLANPQACGTLLGSADLSAWSSPFTPDATLASAFAVDEGCGGGFGPSFDAQSASAAARAFTPFSVTLGRQDGEQDLASVQVTTPVGLLGVLKGVERCPEPQAADGACGANSQIGVASTAVGSGSHPFWVSGPVYLTGPYGGAPFGLSVVVPAKAGPFNLGNVVVRAAISVNPLTAALTVTSAPFPQILDGIPLRIKTVSVDIDRPNFMFNPDDCEAKQVAATLTSTVGTQAHVSSPFAVSGCDEMPFAPSITVSTSGKTSRVDGASLYVKIVDPPAGNVAGKVKVQLPGALPARLPTLQKACPSATFQADPAACPAPSIVGYGRTRSPVLASALEGPAYLVSYGGQAWPELVFVLQGEGVRVDLHGETHITHNVTTSTFGEIPDVPVEFFEAYFPQGPHSVLAAVGNLCKKKLTIPNQFVAYNGARIERSTPIKVTGCPKRKTKAKGRAKSRGKSASARKGGERR